MNWEPSRHASGKHEERTGARLDTQDVDVVLERIRARVSESGQRKLHIDWYGGEPLLNVDFLETASERIRSFCDAEGIQYVASVISNGSLWPDDAQAFIARNRIRQVQISFDGLQENHDKRRRYRKGHRPEEQASSFDRAVALVDKLVCCVRVDLRFNIDRGNSADLLGFIDFARQRGWFSAPYPAVFQPARLSSYSTTSGFMRRQELSLEVFDQLRQQARESLEGEARIEESEIPDGFPSPKTSVCAALARNSEVIGADGLSYRCGLQVGERHRAISIVPLAKNHGIDAGMVGTDLDWWESFDPTTLPTCSVCSFLPICWGGCPKKHLEGDLHATAEQGRYWRTNLPRLIAGRAELGPDCEPVFYPETLQFR
jgi:uncharacterized protein